MARSKPLSVSLTKFTILTLHIFRATLLYSEVSTPTFAQILRLFFTVPKYFSQEFWSSARRYKLVRSIHQNKSLVRVKYENIIVNQ